jgi:hypothetical protein
MKPPHVYCHYREFGREDEEGVSGRCECGRDREKKERGKEEEEEEGRATVATKSTVLL